jgi:hypothetical protein
MAKMPGEIVVREDPPVSPEEAHAELTRILQSPTFDRSERLQKFLEYICELTLNGEGSRINEYLIGSEVFRKGTDYNPNEDSIVRRQAHALRKKLQDYYAAEGKDRPIRVELPVGRYVPNFRRVEQAPAITPEPAASVAAAPPAPTLPGLSNTGLSKPSWLLLAGAVALFGLGLAAGIWWDSSTPAATPLARIGPAIAEIWGPWINSPRDAVICLSNPTAAWVKRLDQTPGPDYMPPRFPMDRGTEAIFRDSLQLPAGGKIFINPSTNAAKLGEAVAGVFLARVLGLAGKPLNVTQSRFLNWEDLRRQNVILLGNNESNQWVDPLLRKYPFRLGDTAGNEPRSIVNTEPLDGEPKAYRIAYSGDEDEADEEYALVSMISGIEGDTQLALIDGLNTQATQMAAEYLTTEARLAELVARLRSLEPGHDGPWHFQAVLKTQVYDKVPTRAALVNVRVLK